MTNWLRSFFSRSTTSGPAPLVEPVQLHQRPYEDLARSEAQLLDRVDALQEEVGRLRYEAELASQRSDHARHAHAALTRRVNDLRRDWPAVHDRYFTKEGIADREAGIPMHSRKKKRK